MDETREIIRKWTWNIYDSNDTGINYRWGFLRPHSLGNNWFFHYPDNRVFKASVIVCEKWRALIPPNCDTKQTSSIEVELLLWQCLEDSITSNYFFLSLSCKSKCHEVFSVETRIRRGCVLVLHLSDYIHYRYQCFCLSHRCSQLSHTWPDLLNGI